MAVDMGSLFMRNLGELRVQPTRKRVRAKIDGETIVDSSRAVLVWEPKRVVPAYAVPVDDVVGGTGPTPDPADGDGRDYSRFPVWDPRVPFSVRTTVGRPVAVGPHERPVAGFIAEDADLDGYVILDFDGFDTWLEEDEEIISHPHDPFSRIDIRDSSARYQLALDGVPVVDTTRARILFETGLRATTFRGRMCWSTWRPRRRPRPAHTRVSRPITRRSSMATPLRGSPGRTRAP